MLHRATSKQNLVGPAIVGCVIGVLAALAGLGFDSEYGPHIYASSTWSLHTLMVLHALVTFFCVACGVIFVFGLGPILFARVLAKFDKDTDV